MEKGTIFTKFHHSIFPLSSISTINKFLPLELDMGFKKMAYHGLISKDHFKAFEQLQSEFKLSKTDFFRDLQIRDFLKKQSLGRDC